MTYLPAIPQPTDIIAQSQVDMLGNFDTLNKIYGLSIDPDKNVGDHVSLTNNDASLTGAHKKLSLIKQASDPAVGATECDLFAKGTTPELYYLRSVDSSANQLTSLGGISIGGLVLRAYVYFDFNGKIINQSYMDSAGNKTETPIQYNVKSIVQNTADKSDWTINFKNNLPTANYMWIVQALCPQFPFMGGSEPRYFQVKNDAYSNSVTASGIRLCGYTKSGALESSLYFQNMKFQAYTVA